MEGNRTSQSDEEAIDLAQLFSAVVKRLPLYLAASCFQFLPNTSSHPVP